MDQQGVNQPTTGNQPAATNPSTQKPIASNPSSTQNSLKISEIRDGIVIMNDGSFRCIIMVKSINFDLMSPQEQENVEFAYQGFLNSLDFPIQICVKTQKIDMQPYLEKLDKIRSEHDNMLLAQLMAQYLDFIEDLSYKTNIMDKKFYVVIPYSHGALADNPLTPSKNLLNGIVELFSKTDRQVVINEEVLETAKTELRNRVQSVLSGLAQANIQGLPLDTQELIELFYDAYNPDTATRQPLRNINLLTADIITKGQGVATQAHLQRELK